MNTIIIDTDFCGIQLEVRFLYEPGRPAEGSYLAPSEHYVPEEYSYVSICEVYKITNTWGKSVIMERSGRKLSMLIDSKREPISLNQEETKALEEIVLEQYEESLQSY